MWIYILTFYFNQFLYSIYYFRFVIFYSINENLLKLMKIGTKLYFLIFDKK